MDSLIERLTAWAINGDGTPGSVPTRYSCEVQLSEHPEAAEVRCAIRRAFIDGMAFDTALFSQKQPTIWRQYSEDGTLAGQSIEFQGTQLLGTRRVRPT